MYCAAKFTWYVAIFTIYLPMSKPVETVNDCLKNLIYNFWKPSSGSQECFDAFRKNHMWTKIIEVSHFEYPGIFTKFFFFVRCFMWMSLHICILWYMRLYAICITYSHNQPTYLYAYCTYAYMALCTTQQFCFIVSIWYKQNLLLK